MAAGLGFKTFTTGEVLTAADVNGYLMQGVLVFANAAARDAAITSPEEGQCCYLKDTDAVLTYSGTAWVGFDDSNAIQNAIINAKGDLIAGSANDTPAILSAGANGETLVADSSATTGLRYQEPKAGNPVINSAFQVWQRGTSISVSASSGTVYTADRWATSTSTNQACTISRQVTNDTTNLPNIQYCARFQRNSGQTGTTAIAFANVFESINSIPFAGKTVTLSFYARKGADYSASSSILQSYLLSGTGTDQNPLAAAYTGSNASIVANNTLTATWQRFSVTGTLPTTATEISAYMVFTPVGTASTNDYYEITGVQLEVGSVATPFKTQGVTLAGELAACQRYYQIIVSGDAKTVVNTAAYDSNSIYGVYRTVVSMRTAPTLSIVSGTGYYKFWGNSNGGVNASSFSLDSASEQGARFTIGGIAVTAGYAYWIMSANASAFAALQAEL